MDFGPLTKAILDDAVQREPEWVVDSPDDMAKLSSEVQHYDAATCSKLVEVLLLILWQQGPRELADAR